MRTKLLRRLKKRAINNILSINIAKESHYIQGGNGKKEIKKVYIATYYKYNSSCVRTTKFYSMDELNYFIQLCYIEEYIIQERGRRELKKLRK